MRNWCEQIMISTVSPVFNFFFDLYFLFHQSIYKKLRCYYFFCFYWGELFCWMYPPGRSFETGVSKICFTFWDTQLTISNFLSVFLLTIYPFNSQSVHFSHDPPEASITTILRADRQFVYYTLPSQKFVF